MDVLYHKIIIGNSISNYYYNNINQGDSIVTLFMPFLSIKDIHNIELTDQWPTYSENYIDIFNPNNEEQIVTSILSKIISNLDLNELVFKRNRDAFNLTISKNKTNYSFFLIHEYYQEPQCKTVQELLTNNVIKFGIDKPDFEIENEIESMI